MVRRSGAGRALPLAAGLAVLAAALSMLAQAPPAAAQVGTSKSAPTTAADPNKPQRVPITTADGVELDGTFYRGRGGRDTPAVMMVHKYGSDRSKSDWIGLAGALQQAGYAVLSFDLRGHGQTT